MQQNELHQVTQNQLYIPMISISHIMKNTQNCWKSPYYIDLVFHQNFAIFAMCSKHQTIHISRLAILSWTEWYEQFCRSMYGSQLILYIWRKKHMKSNVLCYEVQVLQEIKWLKALPSTSGKVLVHFYTQALKCLTHPWDIRVSLSLTHTHTHTLSLSLSLCGTCSICSYSELRWMTNSYRWLNYSVNCQQNPRK